jgi:signal transduction histidine kinase
MVMGIVLLRVVSEGVRPVNKLAGEIESLNETALGRRFSRAAVPDELLPVVDKLNGLMGRLEGAFAREKSFTADVAHELRTPLTGLRTTLEVCRSQPRESAAYETALDECRVITDQMEAMVESLLLLARSDAGQVVVAKQKLDLSELIAETWCLFEYRAQRSNVNVLFDMPQAVVIETDPDKMRIVIQNVLDNAVSYVDPGGQIRIAVHRRGNDAIAEIANSGSQIATEDASRLFERFWRGDVARTDAGAHCGLGLSLCQRLMNLLGGQIAVETAKGGQFVLRIHIAV